LVYDLRSWGSKMRFRPDRIAEGIMRELTGAKSEKRLRVIEFTWRMPFALFLLGAATAIAVPAQTFTTLYSFCSQPNCTDGANPYAGIVQATDGDFYGTTYSGGAVGSGSVFKITPSGSLTTLYSFCSEAYCVDGGLPQFGALVQATNEDIYGLTSRGGGSSRGTIFKISSLGTLTTLYSFCSQSVCNDGAVPLAGLVEAANGDLYGTTYSGGTNSVGPGGSHDAGTVFKITPDGALTTLYNFCSKSACTDGANPYGGLVQAVNGDFYGTTYSGGTNMGGSPGSNDAGTVFKITPAGVLTTLYNFCSQSECTDGLNPNAGLVQAINGSLYGTTIDGGTNGAGTVFRISQTGALMTLYSFCSQSACTDGSNPYAGLIEATDGNLYGVTSAGGTNNSGTIFRITTAGELTTLHTFAMGGGDSTAALFQATDGHFYGTTQRGGADAAGELFRLSVGLGPFVQTLPNAAETGAVVQILGTDLTGTTSVSFNGTPAVFNIVSPTLITTAVPAGATTGYIQVTILNAARLFSGRPFVVRP
jgi:uncharacterized repeat protein (TIGR03803 family)